MQPAVRTAMSYVAFEELFSLVAAADDTHGSHGAGSKRASDAGDRSAMLARMACTAAPFLIVRCALTLRSYAADQPLRGMMPQPLSQRKELLWVLRGLVDLRSESKAIPAPSGAESDTRKHLLRLYPLLVKALGIGRDEKVMELVREALDVVGSELGMA